MDPLLANQMEVSKKYNAASVRGSVTVWIEKGKKSKERSKMENRTVKVLYLSLHNSHCNYRSFLQQEQQQEPKRSGIASKSE